MKKILLIFLLILPVTAFARATNEVQNYTTKTLGVYMTDHLGNGSMFYVEASKSVTLYDAADISYYPDESLGIDPSGPWSTDATDGHIYQFDGGGSIWITPLAQVPKQPQDLASGYSGTYWDASTSSLGEAKALRNEVVTVRRFLLVLIGLYLVRLTWHAWRV
jgi:hypothetical protein